MFDLKRKKEEQNELEDLVSKDYHRIEEDKVKEKAIKKYKPEFVVALLLIVASMLIFRAAYTGLFIYGEAGYSKELNLTFNETATYNLFLNASPLSLKLSGSVVGNGYAKVYLLDNGIRKLIVDSSQLQTSYDLITAYAIAEEFLNETNIPENITNTTEAINQTTNAAENIAEIANQTNLTETSPTLPENITEPANQTENIAINRAPVWIFDADSFIVAGNLTINLSQYFIDLDNDSISYIVSEPENVLILKEFEMITLAPDANIVGNRTIKIFASDLKNTTEKEVTLVINTTKEAAETAPENITIPVKVFDSICVDTCFLTGVGRNITLLIEIENATLNLTKLEYDAKPENITANNPPQCSLIPNVNISKNELSTIWLDKYCSDANDDTLSYDVSLSSKEVDTMITKDMVTFIPRKNFVGTTFMSFVVNDSKNITFTNIIVINVTGNITEKKRNATINLKNNKKEKTGSYSLTNNSDETFDLELSNLPGFGVLEKKKESRINIKKIKELKDADVLIDAIEDNRIGTDVFAINETLDFESAAITLAKNSDVNSVFYCSDFDFETLSCSNWQKTDIPFTDNGNTITFNVTHFSAYAGGLTIINVYSHPSLYGNWIVGFNTTGAANLTITATRESNYTNIYTRWSNESEDSGLYDLRFLEVKCGNQTMNYEWQGTNCFEQECSVFIANYSCNETAQEISKVLTAKRHVLKFEFGGQIAYAYNAVGNESSDSGTDEWRMFGRYLNQTRYTNSAAPTNLANAKIITFSSTSTIQSSPAVANGYVYVGSDDAKLYQLNASNISQQVASFSAAGAIYSSPAVADGYVYILNYNTTIYQLNASNVSQKIASFSTGGGFYNTQSSPVVSNGFVYVGSSLGVLYQLNASNVSQKIANFTAGDGMYTVPAVANGFVYAGSNDAKLYQLNASNVSQQIANFSAGVFYSSAAVANGFVYVGNDDGNLYQLNASNVSQKIANYSTGGAIRSSPAVANGYVYVGSNDNRTYQLNATNVSLLIASYTANNNIQSSPAVTDSYVFIGSYDDKLYQLNATNISILVSSYTTSGDVISSPAVANGSVYVGSLDWKLYQFILDVTYPSINFTQPPTPPNGTTTKNTSVQINISITNASDLAEFKWNWNGTNYTFYNASLVLMMNFDNVSSIGESATNAVDVSKYGNNGTLTNGAVWNCSSGKYGCALQFDGINDLVSIPDSSSWDFGNRDFTVNLWVNFKNLSYASFIDQFWSVRAWVIGYNATALYFRYSTDGTTVNGDHTVPWSANNNTWYYITALRSGSNIRLYVDGSQIGSDFNAGTDVIYNSNKALWVGCAHTGGGGDTPGFCLNGSIDEIRIWNRSLSAAEINQSYMSNLYKYDTDKWAFYTNQTNLTNGSYTYFGYVKDITGNSNQTEVRTLTIGNTAPTATNIILNSTDSLNRTNGTLQGFWTFSDADGDTQQNNETMWYNNSVEIVSLRNLTIVGHGNTTKNENWTFSVRVYDGTDWSSWVNSSVLAIANTMPVASNIQTNNTLPITNEFVAFNATWTDADLNDLKGYIFSSNFNGTWANETPISFGGTTNYSNYSKQVPSTYGEYQWRIYANDSDGAWNDTEIQYITIISNSSEWPMFHHNIVHTGHTSSASPTINNTRWIFITQGSAQSSPAIVNGVVYIGSNDNRTYALNASTGAHIWNFSTKNSVISSPAVANNIVYVGSYDNNTYALNASTGAHIWNFSTNGSIDSSPAVVNAIMYVGSRDKKIYALNASTGAHIWNFTTGNSIIYSSPTIAKGISYIGSNDGKTYALNASTGAHIWNFSPSSTGVVPTTIVFNDVAYTASNNLYALNASTGAHIWNYSAASGSIESSPAIDNGVVYLGDLSNMLNMVNATSGASIRNVTVADMIDFSSPAIANSIIYFGDISGKFYAINASNGVNVWNYTSGNQQIISSPAIADGVVYVGADNGIIYAFGSNRAPTATNIILNSTDPQNRTNGTLSGFWTFSEQDYNDTQQLNETTWYNNSVEVTQFRNITSIGRNATKNQNWTFSVRVYDGEDWSNWSNSSTITIQNTAPTQSTPIINSSMGLNKTNETLYCFNQSTADIDGDAISNKIRWLNNSAAIIALENLTSISHGNTTKNENWTCEITPFDGTAYGTALNSSILTIANLAPTATNIILNSSMKLNKTNETLQGFWTFSDADGDTQQNNETMWYNNSVEIVSLRNLTIVGHGNTTKNENWTFSVRVYDGTDWSSRVNSSVLAISNAVPTHTTPILNSSMILNKTNETLQCFNQSTADIDGDTITNRIRWLNNSIAVASLENQTSIGHGNTTKLQNWTCEVTPYDGTDHGTALNSSILTIANSISATSNVTTYPTLAYKNNTLNCSAVYNDADNDIGTVYFSWYKNNARQNSYTTSLVAGNGAGGYAEGNVTSAMFNYPGHLAVDSAGNTLYLTDYFNAKVRKVNLTTNTTSLISGGFVGSWGIVLFNDTTLYVSDWDNCTIQKINLAMNATSTVAGNGTCGYAEGTGSSAMFNNPSGLAVNSNGTFLYVADYSNNRIRRIDLTTNTTSLIAGNGTAGYTEGVGNQTKFNNPYAATISPDNHYLYISDSGSHRIRRIDLTTNTTSLIAGNGTRGYLEGTGINAMLNGPDQTSMNSEGTMLYFIEPSGNRVRAINLTTNTTLLVAGNGTPDYLEGSFINVMVSGEGLVSNPSGTKLYISDSNNNRIRVINLNNSYDATVANVTSGTLAWTNIFVPSSALTKNDNWTCSAIAYDGTIFSNWVNSSSVMINNSAPILNSSISAQNWSEGGSATINLSLYFTDIDNDNLIYNSTMPSDITISINQTSKIAALTAVGSWYGENFITFNATDGSLNATSNNITLTLSNIIRCGDGIKEGSEECDDGNTVSGDGCSASCAIEGSGGGGSGGGGGGVTPPAQPTQPPPEQPPQPTPEEQPPELPPEQPPQVEFPETITQPQTIIIAGATSTINTVPCFNYTENKTLALKQSNITKAMNIPKGYSVLINPFSPDCAKGSLTLTFNIPNNYVDVNALKCKGDECSPAIIEETTKLKCGGKIVKEFRRNTSYLEPILMPINITKTDMIIKYEKDTIESGKYKIKFLNEINQKVSISMPSEAVREPENTNLKIIATPLIVTFENRTAINAVISLPYILGKNIENDSIAIYIKINETWNHIGGDINYEENKITATMNNLEEFLDENNQATIAVMGIICLYCEKSELNKVYDPKTSREAVILVHGFERSPERFNDIINDIKLTRQPWQTWTFAYPSSKTIEENGKQFAELLELNINEYDNLYFVAHSLGGLITQQALYYGYEHNYSFVNKARKAVLIASPNKGSISEGVYRNLYNFLMNSKTAELFNIKGAVVKELVYGKAIPEVPGMEYKVIAGTKSYGFVKITKSNDGLVTVESAQTVGGKIINNSCENYWAINVTHTDILDNIESKQIIERIIAEEVAKVVGSGKSLLGSNQYIELNIPECSYEDTYVIVGKEIKEEKLPDITGCSCGNGYCGLDETAASCPQDCARIISKENIELIALLALAVVLLMSLMAALTALYKKIRRHKIGRPLRYTLLTLITAGAAIYLAKSYFVDDKYQFLGNAVAMILALAVFFILFFFSSKLLNLILKHTRIKQAKIPIKAKPKLQHKLLPDFKNLIKVLHENLAIRLRNYENKRKLLKSLKEKKLQELRAKKELERKRRAAEQEKVRLLKEQERIRKLEEQERLKKLEEERKKRELEEKERLKTFKEIEKQRILEDIRKLKAIKTKVSDAAILLKENVNKAKQLYLEILENYKKLAAGKRKDVYNEVIGLYDKLKEAARLEKYIKNTLNAVIDKKLTIDQLKSALRQKGWNKDAIEAALAAAKQEFYRERIKEVTDKIEAAKKEYCKPIYNNIIDVYAYLGLDDLFEAKRLYLRTLELYARSPSYVQAEVYNDLQKLYRLLFKRGMGNAK